LGSGNHFIEVLSDENEQIWLMLHSGSRRLGKETCDYYHNLAAKQLKKRKITHPIRHLLINSPEGQDYLNDMVWCLLYAKENRRLMMKLLMETIKEVTGHQPNPELAVNIHHNYANWEHCTYVDPKTGKEIKEKLLVTRKGATSAQNGEYGIIPGSMGTGSFIVKGKGNSLSWSSCSHGAGRVMSRTQAKKQISQEDFVKVMSGIVCDTFSKLRDEAPQAYKPLSKVMQNQVDLIDIVHRLKPVINVKGFH